MTGPFSSADDDTGADTDTFDSSTQSESGESDLEHSTHNDEGSEEEEEEGEGKMEGLDQGAKALGFFSSIRNTQLAKKKMLGPTRFRQNAYAHVKEMQPQSASPCNSMPGRP